MVLWWIAAESVVVLGMMFGLGLLVAMFLALVRTIKSPYDAPGHTPRPGSEPLVEWRA
jgi:hypothetical protein